MMTMTYDVLDALEFDLGGSLKENFMGGVIFCVVIGGVERSNSSFVTECKNRCYLFLLISG